MNELTQDLSLAQARSLIDSYDFDLGRDNVENLFEYWLDLYHANWIRLATIEALYLGRYKGISVEHILNVWLRLGNPNPHFTYEFERLICRKLPKHLSDLSNLTASATTASEEERHSPLAQDNSELRATPIAEPKSTTVKNDVAPAEKEHLNLEMAFTDPAPKSDISMISAWELSCRSNWNEFAGDSTIHKFIPLPDVSSFFTRLKTFGEENPEG